jgi:hypothetical protein
MRKITDNSTFAIGGFRSPQAVFVVLESGSIL